MKSEIPKYIPVEGDDNRGLFRDKDSNAVLLRDKDIYDKYMQSYSERQRKKNEFATLQTEVNELKSDVSDIKSLLIQLINKGE
jgi:septal ring factor EnvC (AmiA/AmiB activator)|tara:strand:+ start:936 stop:1184 length:249 start_codon:yes stop_codon:yes gene_type:complete